MTPQIQKDKRAQEEALGDDQIALQADADEEEYVEVIASKPQKKIQRKGRKDYN